MNPFESNISRAARIEVGLKGVAFNSFFLDNNIGVIYGLDN